MSDHFWSDLLGGDGGVARRARAVFLPLSVAYSAEQAETAFVLSTAGRAMRTVAEREALLFGLANAHAGLRGLGGRIVEVKG